MARAPLLVRARAGEPVWGTFVKLAGDATVDLASSAGYDFVLVDLEHSQLGEHEALGSIRRAAAVELASLVRVAEISVAQINRLLEAGAAGVQVAGVRRRRDVGSMVAATRYPPDGSRSVSMSQPAAGYGRRSLIEFLQDAHDHPPILVGQIESATTDDELEDVVAGLDVVFIGPTDLAADMGLPGAAGHPQVATRMRDIAAAAAAVGSVLGGWAASATDAGALLALGARYLVVASDVQLLSQAMRQAVATCRESFTRAGETGL